MTPVNNTTYKYFAFISYNTIDTEWGKKTQRDFLVLPNN